MFCKLCLCFIYQEEIVANSVFFNLGNSQCGIQRRVDGNPLLVREESHSQAPGKVDTGTEHSSMNEYIYRFAVRLGVILYLKSRLQMSAEHTNLVSCHIACKNGGDFPCFFFFFISMCLQYEIRFAGKFNVFYCLSLTCNT